MTTLIFNLVEFGTPSFDEVLQLRNRVLRQPLGMVFKTTDITEEWKEHHFALYSSRYELLGCLTLKPMAHASMKMRQVAVEPSYQGRGYGKHLVGSVELWCVKNGIDQVEMNARQTAVQFYLNLDYSIVGEEFFEVGIPHRKMKKSIHQHK